MTCKRVSFFLAIIFTTLGPWAQAADEPVNSDNSAVLDTEDSEGLVLNQADINNENDTELEQTEGDDDFVPSAQISEDLSVSFPVDI